MKKIIENIKERTNNSNDYIYREIKINNTSFYCIYNETLTNTNYINDYILKNIFIFKTTNFYHEYLNTSNIANIKVITENEILSNILSGHAVLIFSKTQILSMEAKQNLDRSISNPETEKVLFGPKDSFVENYNKNLGLIRKRIKSENLFINDLKVGSLSNTKVGILYMKNIANPSLVDKITSLIKKIEIDGIIDSSYIKERLNNESNKYFPTIMTTERPDNVAMALLEGKIAIITDNSPFVLILPTLFIDYFKTADDYYQKSVNTTFTRILRLLAFIIAIFLPAYYIALTSINQGSIPTSLLLNLIQQRLDINYPIVIEALIMIILFEILKETDTRSPEASGTSISIIGGLVLGSAAVDASIVSPLMIIVIALSITSGMAFQSTELNNSIRYFRILNLILSFFFGILGIFIGLIILIVNLSSIKNYCVDYTSPFSPPLKEELSDSFVKYEKKGIKKRNPVITKNLERGKNK